MDYLQFQTKYINNKILESGEAPLIEESVPDYSNISYLNGEAAPATALIQNEEDEIKFINPVLRRTTKPISIKPSKGLSIFNLNYDLALRESSGNDYDQLMSRRNLFTRLANKESSFDFGSKNKGGVPAYGYFQFMLGNYRGDFHNNVGEYAGVDLDTFRKSPVILIKAANKLANYFLRCFSKTEILRLHLMGYSDSAIIAGSWLGGPGGVRAFAFNNHNRSDIHGTSVGKYMQMFNNL